MLICTVGNEHKNQEHYHFCRCTKEIMYKIHELTLAGVCVIHQNNVCNDCYDTALLYKLNVIS